MTMIGIKTATAAVSMGRMEIMKYSDMTTMMLTCSRCVSCSETKTRMVSISDVHRWMISPVLFSPIHA